MIESLEFDDDSDGYDDYDDEDESEYDYM
jgi:hypothetical protein